MSILVQYVVPDSLLFCLVWGMAASVDSQHFRSKFENRSGILVGLGCQFLLLPLLGFLVVKVMQLPSKVGIPLLLVVSSPGGSYSNWWCSLFNADLALSVAMTVASTSISSGMLPLNCFIYVEGAYGQKVHIEWQGFFIPVAVVIVAIVLGVVCGRKLPQYRDGFQILGNISGILLIVFSYFASHGTWRHRGLGFYIAVALPCLLGLLVSAVMASYPRFGLTKPERTAVCIECCYQNVGIAQAIALTMFHGDDKAIAVSVPLYYGFVEALACATFSLVSWKLGFTFAPPTDPLWAVLVRNYQDGASGRSTSVVDRSLGESLLFDGANGSDAASIKESQEYPSLVMPDSGVGVTNPLPEPAVSGSRGDLAISRMEPTTSMDEPAVGGSQ